MLGALKSCVVRLLLLGSDELVRPQSSPIPGVKLPQAAIPSPTIARGAYAVVDQQSPLITTAPAPWIVTRQVQKRQANSIQGYATSGTGCEFFNARIRFRKEGS